MLFGGTAVFFLVTGIASIVVVGQTGSVIYGTGIRDSDNDVLCPDKQSHCPTGTTCCALSGTTYGCCPIPNAVCCSDHLHCCPSGYTCDLQHSQCNSIFEKLPLSRKFPAGIKRVLSASVSDEEEQQQPKDEEENKIQNDEVICPDKKSRCPAGTTCCPLDGHGSKRTQFWKAAMHKRFGNQSTRYGCCPAVQAVCCSDHLHCCPHGTTCDVQEGRCIQQGHDSNSDEQQQSMLRHSHHTSRKIKTTDASNSVKPTWKVCGTGIGKTAATICPIGSKCCRHRNSMDGRKWNACCPFSDGQCCAHSAHCCFAGFVCTAGDNENARCISTQPNGITLSTRMFSTTEESNQKRGKLSCCQNGKENELVCCPYPYKCNNGMGTENDEAHGVEKARCERMNFLEIASHMFW